MKTVQNHPVSCCTAMPSLGALESKDIAALDHLAVKLICLDSGFAPSFVEIGRSLGHHIAVQRHPEPVSFDTALASLQSLFGFEGAIRLSFLCRSADEALAQIIGCNAALGWQIPRLDRAVCIFDAGLLEGFLRHATRDEAWSVRETACLGMGHAACEFRIHRHHAEAALETEKQHDQR